MDGADFDFKMNDGIPRVFDQDSFNKLVRELGLSKEKAEKLARHLKQRNLLDSAVKITYSRSRNESLKDFFETEGFLTYCTDVPGLLEYLTVSTDPKDYRLFIDASKSALKAVLLSNGNKISPVPIAYSSVLKESYETMKFLLECIKYNLYNWDVCVDLKVVAFLVGLQSGYTKYMCFKCLWDSRDRKNHWVISEWPCRGDHVIGSRNAKNPPLVPTEKIIFPPLHSGREVAFFGIHSNIR